MVVTYAYNEDSYKAKWQESRAEIAALQGRLDAQSGEFDAVKTGLSTRAAELEASLRAARNDAADASATVERLRDDLSQAKGMNAQIANDISTLASAVSANQDLTESLIDELASIRQEADSGQSFQILRTHEPSIRTGPPLFQLGGLHRVLGDL